MNKSTLTLLISLGAAAACFFFTVTCALGFYTLARGGFHSTPSIEESRQLARRSISDINRAVKTRDFVTYHSTLSPVWRRQISPAELGTILNDFVAKQIHFDRAEVTDPVFLDQPRIDGQGTLVLTGEFRTPPLRTLFEFRYRHSDGAWKPVGFNVNKERIPGQTSTVSQPQPQQQGNPSDAGYRRLAALTLDSFRAAVESGDFTAFHSTLSSPFRNKYTPQQIRDTFIVFSARQISLRRPENTDVVLEEPPSITENGMLQLKGYYPQPYGRGVVFDLLYYPENGAWKLIKIDVEAGQLNDA